LASVGVGCCVLWDVGNYGGGTSFVNQVSGSFPPKSKRKITRLWEEGGNVQGWGTKNVADLGLRWWSINSRELLEVSDARKIKRTLELVGPVA
jgi:hypothetical protein